MKKFLIPFVVFFSLTGMVFAGSFPDVPEDNDNFAAIEFLDSKEIIKGYSDGAFKPDGLINRAEALKIITGAAEIKTDGEFDILFPDVLKTDWFFPHVMTAHGRGIVTGYKDGKFKPANNVTLSETLKMLTLAFNAEMPAVETDVYTDVMAADWFAPYFLYAKNNNLILPDDNGKVSPDQVMTRGALAEVVYRMTIVAWNDGKPFPLYKDWPQYQGALPFKIRYDKKEWQISANKDEIVFLRPDKQFVQFSAARIYPNGGVVRAVLDKNEGDVADGQYFENIKGAFAGWTFREFLLGQLKALEAVNANYRAVDWYIYLPDKNVLAVYTQYGPGTAGWKLQKFISAMLETLEYREIPPTVENSEEILSRIFEKILVNGKGMEALNLLPEKTLFETDVIGLGAGPVDYYYTTGLDYTFKYERNSDTILDKRTGKTPAF
ncbi:S-layer homology domain-containing protein [Candidatus Peregrinibacteria bacterium]|nr:S-layer homology domain-containing protein [Candidatus Peregrinibacteria bacterium]